MEIDCHGYFLVMVTSQKSGFHKIYSFEVMSLQCSIKGCTLHPVCTFWWPGAQVLLLRPVHPAGAGFFLSNFSI